MIDVNSDTAFTHHTLDALSARSQAAIHNIANQNVAGFKRFEVQFEDLLRDAVADGEKEGSVEHLVARDESGPPGANNVVLMEELTMLGKTQLMHDYMLRRAAGYFSTVNKAIFGRA
ncbi:MAG: flagellar basal body rod protein FlgB [Planctomycetota bacterium]